MILADKIIAHRKRMGITQEELASELGVFRQSISKWEGAQSIPDMERIILLADFFGVSIDYLLKDEMEDPEFTDFSSQKAKSLSLEETNGFLHLNEKSSKIVSLGVFLCIASPILLILFNQLYENNLPILSEDKGNALGLIILIPMVAGAVGLFIQNSLLMKPFDFLNEEIFESQYGVKSIVLERKNKFQKEHTNNLIAGVILIIIATVPIFISELLVSMPLLRSLSVPTLLFMIATGVYILVKTSIRNSGYDKILQIEDYTPPRKKHARIFGKIAGIYWLAVVAIYLGWSFTNNEWGKTWIIWPVAGVLFGVVSIIVSLFISDKE